MRQYYILNSHPQLKTVFEFIQQHDLEHQVHLNRTRFWIATHTPAYTEFVLRFSDHCPPVDPMLDPVTGL